jgi:protein-tyrosine kinase
MESIRQAVERAKGPGPNDSSRRSFGLEQKNAGANAARVASGFHEVALDAAYLQSQRIIAHGVTNPLSRPYDMLRTQVIQAMEEKGSKVLAITSPTPGCGKTVTSINLALSIARHPEKSVLLIDLDLRKPKVASYLGFEEGAGLLQVLDGSVRLHDAIVETRIGNQRLLVLTTGSTHGSSDLMASREMAGLFHDLRREFVSSTVIVDLPPILSSDDVITVLPHIDCALLVAAVGGTKASDIEECGKHLRSTDILRVVVNKSTEATNSYYYY